MSAAKGKKNILYEILSQGISLKKPFNTEDEPDLVFLAGCGYPACAAGYAE